jgi:phage-related protein
MFEKPLVWIGLARREYLALPRSVQQEFGFALSEAQLGRKVTYAKPLRGFGDAAVIELVRNTKGEAWRAIYTVRFEGVIYVLAALHKKSISGVGLPEVDRRRILQRLQQAKALHDSGGF